VTKPDDIWPKDSPRADPGKLVDFVRGLAADLKKNHPKVAQDPETARNIAAAENLGALEKKIEVAENIAAAPLPNAIYLNDLPLDCLCGWLGEVCDVRMSDLPRAYAWPALLAVASTFLAEQNGSPPTMLYVCLVGPVHSGKTQAIERAVKILGADKPQLLRVYSGSGEQLVKRMEDAMGNPRLLWVDELSHLFKKSQIDRASFPQLLNDAYYNTHLELTVSGKKPRIAADVKLSLIGGMPEELFQDSFAKESVGGQHDRFLFGLCPGDFHFKFAPLRGGQERLRKIPIVEVQPSVWEAKREYLVEHPTMNPRVLEMAIRSRLICAAFSGQKMLLGSQLDSAFQLADYQMRIRGVLQPNTGDTIEGKACSKILSYLMRYGGKWISRRQMLHDTRVYDLGPATAERVTNVLVANGDIEQTKIGKQVVLRWITPAEQDGEGTEN